MKKVHGHYNHRNLHCKDENKNLKKAALDFAKLICIKDNLPTLSSRKRNINQTKPIFSTVNSESCSRTTSPQQNTEKQRQNYKSCLHLCRCLSQRDFYILKLLNYFM